MPDDSVPSLVRHVSSHGFANLPCSLGRLPNSNHHGLANSEPLGQFCGPLTAVKINEWLLTCESTFGSWDAQHQGSELSDERKVRIAGNQIFPHGLTSDLRNWWNDTDDITTWAAFKEGIMEEALGSDWRVRVLQDFYSTKQEGSVDKYITSLRDIKSVIKHGVGNTAMKEIDDFTYKCYMLFNANPALAAKIMDDSGLDIIAVNSDAMRRKLSRVAS
jgi:hypothetical protein